MRSRSSKRAPLFGFVAGAAVIAMAAGPAFACTQFLGASRITATDIPASSEIYGGDGSDQDSPSKGYCTSPSRRNFETKGTLKLEVWRDSPCLNEQDPVEPDPYLPSGTYQLRMAEANDDAGATHSAQYSCNGPLDPAKGRVWVPLGVMEVGASVTEPSAKEFVLPPKIGKVNICLDNGSGISPPMVFMNLI